VALSDRSLLPLRCCAAEHSEVGDTIDNAVRRSLPKLLRQKYETAVLEKVSKNKMFCPVPTCGALIVLDDGVKDALRGTPVACPGCFTAVCTACKAPWHEGLSCLQFQFFADKADSVAGFCRRQNWMRCFECGHVVEKRAGCDHITCVCGAQFCYKCGTKWGECNCHGNMLGGTCSGTTALAVTSTSVASATTQARPTQNSAFISAWCTGLMPSASATTLSNANTALRCTPPTCSCACTFGCAGALPALCELGAHAIYVSNRFGKIRELERDLSANASNVPKSVPDRAE